MRFSKLFISNFRSFDRVGESILFTPDCNLAVFIGANSSGKSNALTALGIVLGAYPFSRFSPQENDFHLRNTEAEIKIELYLDPPLVGHDVYRKEFQVAGFRYRAGRREIGDRRGLFFSEHYCFGPDGKNLVKPIRMFRQKGKADDGVENSPKPVFVDDFSWMLGDMFYLDSAGLDKFFDRTTGWSPLGRLFDIYRDDFDADHNIYSPEPDKKMTSKAAYERFSRRLSEILRTAKLEEIETGLSDKIRTYLKAKSEDPLKIQLALPAAKELFDRFLSLRVNDYEGIPALPIENLGSGYRALLRLSVLETLLGFQPEKRFILLIEEPEIYLHFHLKKYFYEVLDRLAREGHQIVYTTHSPEFLSLGNPEQIKLLRRDRNGKTAVNQISDESTEKYGVISKKIRRMKNEELLFAEHVVLTEGQDDQAVITELLTRRGVDLNAVGISVVNCDSVTQLPDYIRLCLAFRLDFYVVHDRDDETLKRTKDLNQDITDLVNQRSDTLPHLHVFDPNLEAAFGLKGKQRQNVNVLLGLLEGKTFKELELLFPQLVNPVTQFAESRALAVFDLTKSPVADPNP